MQRVVGRCEAPVVDQVPQDPEIEWSELAAVRELDEVLGLAGRNSRWKRGGNQRNRTLEMLMFRINTIYILTIRL